MKFKSIRDVQLKKKTWLLLIDKPEPNISDEERKALPKPNTSSNLVSLLCLLFSCTLVQPRASILKDALVEVLHVNLNLYHLSFCVTYGNEFIENYCKYPRIL